MGPSPLTRGSRRAGQRRARNDGSIPAHAGQPKSPTRGAVQTWVHPRSRGAAHPPRWRARSRRGSIPAHAGQPVNAALVGGEVMVHPRSRGAARGVPCQYVAARGPSPLTRGSQAEPHAAADSTGSIPAHAGQPEPAPPLSASGRVHPRSRGAAHFPAHGTYVEPGPSPLTRGSHRSRSPPRARGGSIPAHAGQPRWAAGQRRPAWVHPRSRGAARIQGFRT